MNTQFSGMYRVSGDNKLKVQLAGAKIVLKEPFKAAARDGNDMVILTQKDAMNFMKQEYNIDTPAVMEQWSLKDWVNPKNFTAIKNFANDIKDKMTINGNLDIKALEKQIVDYFRKAEVQNGIDAYGNAIQNIKA